MFEIVPAGDLKAGRSVSLLQGAAASETVFCDDPVAMARRWEASGARRLHVVDLDGAFAGGPVQTDLVRAMIRAVSIPVEVGGGLREMAHVETVLDAGARWAIVGTRAALDPAFLGEVCERFGERLMIGIDASDGRVAVDGWTRVLDLDAMALARDAAAAGAGGVIYTDTRRGSRAPARRAGPISGARKRWPGLRASRCSPPAAWDRSRTSDSLPPCPAWPE